MQCKLLLCIMNEWTNKIDWFVWFGWTSNSQSVNTTTTLLTYFKTNKYTSYPYLIAEEPARAI